MTDAEPDARRRRGRRRRDRDRIRRRLGGGITDPDELMKQKYRDALAHKHGTSGAKKGHGDAGE